jgi:hypothetical protein
MTQTQDLPCATLQTPHIGASNLIVMKPAYIAHSHEQKAGINSSWLSGTSTYWMPRGSSGRSWWTRRLAHPSSVAVHGTSLYPALASRIALPNLVPGEGFEPPKYWCVGPAPWTAWRTRRKLLCLGAWCGWEGLAPVRADAAATHGIHRGSDNTALDYPAFAEEGGKRVGQRLHISESGSRFSQLQ